MPRNNKNNNLVTELVAALSDKRVRDLLGDIFQEKMQAVLNKVEALERENEKQNEEIVKLKSDLNTANAKLDDLEAYNRRDNLIIAGLPPASYAEASPGESEPTAVSGEHANATEELVLALCQKLQVPITSADISIAHRLKSRNAQEPPPVIIRFATRKARDTMYSARFQLKNLPNKIFINEDLTQRAAQLFARARQLVKQKVIYSAWTKTGAVFIKRDNNPSSRPTCIRSTEDLSDLLQRQ